MLGHEAKSTKAAIYDEIKIPNWETTREIRALRLCGKIIKLPDTNLTKQLYNYECMNVEQSYWAKSIKNILTSLKLEEWWNTSTIKTNKKTGRWHSY